MIKGPLNNYEACRITFYIMNVQLHLIRPFHKIATSKIQLRVSVDTTKNSIMILLTYNSSWGTLLNDFEFVAELSSKLTLYGVYLDRCIIQSDGDLIWFVTRYVFPCRLEVLYQWPQCDDRQKGPGNCTIALNVSIAVIITFNSSRPELFKEISIPIWFLNHSCTMEWYS